MKFVWKEKLSSNIDSEILICIGHTVLSLLLPQNNLTNPTLSITNREPKNDFPLRALPIIEIVFVLRFPVEIASYFFFWCKYSTISSDFQIGPADVSANGTGKLLSLFLQFETLLLLVPHKFATSLRASSSLSITIQTLLIKFCSHKSWFRSHKALILLIFYANKIYTIYFDMSIKKFNKVKKNPHPFKHESFKIIEFLYICNG